MQLKREVGALVLCVLRHLPETVEGFNRFSASSSGGGEAAAKATNATTTKLSLSSTIARGVYDVRGLDPADRDEPSTPELSGAGVTLVQEMLEPELAGLQPRNTAGPLAQVRHDSSLILFSSLAISGGDAILPYTF